MYLDNKERVIGLIQGDNPNDLDELSWVINNAIMGFLPALPDVNDYYGVLGVLEGVKMEFMRRGLAPLNDERMALNGDAGYADLPQNSKV